MKAKDRPGKWKSLAHVLAVISLFAAAQSVAVRDARSAPEKVKSIADQVVEQKSVAESNAATHYSATMRYANWLEQATNKVPSPSTFSELYLKQLGAFKVSCQTNRRSGTIDYRVDGCQTTNIDAVFASVRQMPNRVRVSQGTNSVTIAIRLPTQ